MKGKAGSERANKPKNGPFNRLARANVGSEFESTPKTARKIGADIGDLRHTQKIGHPPSSILIPQKVENPQNHPHRHRDVELAERRNCEIDNCPLFFSKMERKKN